MRFRGSSVLFYLLLIGLIFPYEATVIPLYYVFKDAGLTDTLWALILPQIGLSVPFGDVLDAGVLPLDADGARRGVAPRRRVEPRRRCGACCCRRPSRR